MDKLNIDVLFLILENLEDCAGSLFNSVSVNRNWCKIVTKILWRNPWRNLDCDKAKFLHNTILSHLRNKTYLNYINLIRFLDLSALDEMCNSSPDVANEILSSFVNKNTSYIHLY